MSDIVRCPNGHFYDREKTPECPWCDESGKDKLSVNIYGEIGEEEDRELDDTPTVAFFPESDEEISLEGGSRSDKVHITDIPWITWDQHIPKELPTGRASREDPMRNPLSGWIVCVKGPNIGRDYAIRQGRNWIGGGKGCDILIEGDSAIAEGKHCSIVYDSKWNRFYLAGGNDTLTYYKGALVEKPVTLSSGDAFQIGESGFEFIQFCREGHSWEDIVKE